MTAIPWVAFTSFLHPLPTTPGDSLPRFAWGRRFEDGSRVSMPLGGQAHLAIMDGVHVGNLCTAVQECLSHPRAVFDHE